MSLRMKHRALEKHPWFPYIAWMTVVGFALFTGSLALELNTELDHIAEQRALREAALERW